VREDDSVLEESGGVLISIVLPLSQNPSPRPPPRPLPTGHKYTGWKNRYFVLTATTLAYYKEEIAEGASSGHPEAGSLLLAGAKVGLSTARINAVPRRHTP